MKCTEQHLLMKRFVRFRFLESTVKRFSEEERKPNGAAGNQPECALEQQRPQGSSAL